jgi:hypothetical protein
MSQPRVVIPSTLMSEPTSQLYCSRPGTNPRLVVYGARLREPSEVGWAFEADLGLGRGAFKPWLFWEARFGRDEAGWRRRGGRAEAECTVVVGGRGAEMHFAAMEISL